MTPNFDFSQCWYGGWIKEDGEPEYTYDDAGHEKLLVRLREDCSYARAYEAGWVRFVSGVSLSFRLDVSTASEAALRTLVQFLRDYEAQESKDDVPYGDVSDAGRSIPYGDHPCGLEEWVTFLKGTERKRRQARIRSMKVAA